MLHDARGAEGYVDLCRLTDEQATEWIDQNGLREQVEYRYADLQWQIAAKFL